ncbi:MAG: hypothetical protein RI932_564 [Pseudomonadota bacterium]|jgi:hypothetical protein
MKHNQLRLRAQILGRISLVSVVFPILSCSPVDGNDGRCKKLTDPKYVASISDTDGKPWKIEVIPEAVDLTCDAKDGGDTVEGLIVFSARVIDSQGQTKPGLRVSGRFSGASPDPASTAKPLPGFYPNPYKIIASDVDDVLTKKQNNQDKLDDVATDGCGVAVFYVKWVCPGPKKSIGGSFYVESGPLFSKPIKVTLENSVQPDVAVPGTVGGGAAGGGAAGP